MSMTEIREVLQAANNLPFGYPIESDGIHARGYEVDQVAYMFGDLATRKMVALAVVTDKGYVWNF